MKVTSENYNGKLYIKLGRKYIPLEQDIVYFEKLEQENGKLKNRNAELRGMYIHSEREASTYKQFLELKEKENVQLKQKIEKMHNCKNCKHFVFNGFHQQNECSKYSCEWELAE